MILISACLCGIPCRYDGKSQPSRWAVEQVRLGNALPVCPEVLGGLMRPNPPAEITGGTGLDVLRGTARLINRVGEDVTAQYLAGAYRTLWWCRELNVEAVYLKTRSPSCGIGEVYDGSFSGTLIPGNGVTAALLTEHGIRVIPLDKDRP